MKAECATKTVVEMTMSSLEIAEKVEKRHDNVKRSVKRLEEKGLIEVLKIEKVKIQGERRVEEIEVYQLSKRDGQVVAAQLSRKFMNEILSKIEQLDGSSLFTELKQDLDEKVRTKRYVTTANGKAITSIEIAEQTGKKHSQVIRDIRVMIERLEREKETFGKPKEDKDERGYTTCYYLDGLLTETLLMGYKSAPERFKEIERRYRIEEQASTVDQIDNAANAMEEKQHLQSQKEEERIEAEKKGNGQ